MLETDVNTFGQHSLISWDRELLEREAEMTEQELLAVLDMTEEEQYIHLEKHQGDYEFELDYIKFGGSSAWAMVRKREAQANLADLAFRLRDEAMKEDSDSWALACWYVQQWIGFHKIIEPRKPALDGLLNADHEILSKSPIVWIVTAIKAKELAKK